MKTKFFLILISLFFVGNQMTSGQVNDLLNKAKNKAGKTAEKTVEKRVLKATEKSTEKVVNSAIDKVVSKSKKKSKNSNETETSDSTEVENSENMEQSSENSSGGNGILGNVLSKYSGGENLKYNDEYVFTADMKYSTETFDEKGKSTGQMYSRMLFAKDNKNMAMISESTDPNEKNTSQIIFDGENQVMVMLNDKDKSGMVMGSGTSVTEEEQNEQSNSAETEEVQDYSNINFTKTGKTKTILGYKCDEYLSKDENTESHFWITNQLLFKSGSALNKMNQMNNAYSLGQFPGGFVMEMNSKNLQDKTSSTFKVVEINENKTNKISTKGYQLIKMGSGVPNQK
jgi:hypothetical protein